MHAYRIVYEHFEKPLLNTALRMLGNQHDAEDAVQQAFIKLYRNIGKFRFKSMLGTYLFRILMNVCFDSIERRKKEAMRQAEFSEQSYSIQPDLKLHLEQAISELPEKMRACFVLHAIQGQKLEEISHILDIRLGTVKAHIFAAKAKLRATFFESIPGETA